MRIVHGLRSINGISPHLLLVGLGVEQDDHGDGRTLCPTVSLDNDALVLDDATVYEAGQPAGQLSQGRLGRIAAGLTELGPDAAVLVAYFGRAPGTATLAQTQEALQVLMRVVRRLTR